MKRLKYYTLIGILFVLITGTLSHFVYEWTGNNTFLGLFCPVSESTWEHMKLVFFPMLVYGFFMYCGLVYSKHPASDTSSMEKELTPNETAGALAAGILTGVLLVPALFYTYSGILGDNYLFLDIMVFVLSVLAAFRVVYRLLNHAGAAVKHARLLEICSPFLVAAVLLLLVCFLIFTYQPPKPGIFAIPDEAAAFILRQGH